MKFFKVILGFILFVAVCAGAAQAAFYRGLIPVEPIKKLGQVLAIFNRPELAQLNTTLGQQTTVLTSHTGEVASKAGTVLGTHIQANEAKTPVFQKTFDQARYKYCQEVIVDYETRFGVPQAEP